VDIKSRACPDLILLGCIRSTPFLFRLTSECVVEWWFPSSHAASGFHVFVVSQQQLSFPICSSSIRREPSQEKKEEKRTKCFKLWIKPFRHQSTGENSLIAAANNPAEAAAT
jgi:hypothetical protein